MQEFDIIVIGAGSGLDVASALANRGEDVAVVEPGPMGGTCLNRGCIPSKMLIHHADVAATIEHSEEFNITSSIHDIDFSAIVEEVNETVTEDAENIEKGIRSSDTHTLYKEEARFVDDKTVEVGDEEITAPTIIVAAGARPLVPPIEGIEDVDYLTSKEVLELSEQPDRIVVIGGGYIAMELAHFYKSLGTDVTILEMNDRLISREDRDISVAFTELSQERYDVNLGLKATRVEEENGRIMVHAEDKEGDEHGFEGDELLVAAGRVPNTDRLDLDTTDIETDDRGFIETDDHMETAVDGVYALGDIAGNYMFKHSANYEAENVLYNIVTGEDTSIDYTAMPHAIFSHPQISGVGTTEQELEDEDVEYDTATYEYGKTGMGLAHKEEDGFVKVIAEEESGRILGCHVMGPHASSIIHEVLVAMRAGTGRVHDIQDTIHIHPALNEVVHRAFNQF
jgi:dihydrolipoamide dehydrogenase